MTASSPCVNICQIDPANGLCTGCLRTLDEIMRWSRMPETERQAIMDRLPDRKPAKAGDQPRP